MKGKVKFFNEEKGYGFVTADDGKDYFVHKSGIVEGVNIKENDAVEFEIEQSERGPKATKVKKAESKKESEESEDFE